MAKIARNSNGHGVRGRLVKVQIKAISGITTEMARLAPRFPVIGLMCHCGRSRQHVFNASETAWARREVIFLISTTEMLYEIRRGVFVQLFYLVRGIKII